MVTFDSITFLDTIRGNPDRGWSPLDVQRVLDVSEIPFRTVFIRDSEQLVHLIETSTQPTAFWPLNYTFESEPSGLKLVEIIDGLNKPIIGCRSAAAAFTSKLIFKRALRSAGLSTPPWMEWTSDNHGRAKSTMSLPLYAKAEYSCDSIAIHRITQLEEIEGCANDLGDRFRQTVFLEEEAGRREWTVACIVTTNRLLLAALSLTPKHASFIDFYSKHHNGALDIRLPSEDEHQRLSAFVEDMARKLPLSGYFRVDLVEGANGELSAIDMNVLPWLNADPVELSYLPMAFMSWGACSYSDVVGAIVSSAESSRGVMAPGSKLADFVQSSKLLAP